MPETSNITTVHAAPESPWKTWAPAVVGLAGLVLSILVQTHQTGSSKLAEQNAKLAEKIAESTKETTKLTEKVEVLCQQHIDNTRINKEQDARLNSIEAFNARVMQKLGMTN
jgi:2-methylcitrate dehydratase PrpD